MKRIHEKFVNKSAAEGSALLLAVVLTSLLAIVGMMFVISAHVEKTSTSAVAENRELRYFVKYVASSISEQLAADVPGVAGAEYYDYPGTEDRWLASLEPYESGGIYSWRQISDVNVGDVTGYINRMGWTQRNIDIEIVPDHSPIDLDNNGDLTEQPADADGDGVSDSKWIELDGITSSKGDNIYAAIRVIDNGGMINVNTGYKFDATIGQAETDGSSQMQINLAALSQRGSNGTLGTAADTLQELRCGNEPTDITLYEQNVIWRYGNPNGEYTPFDISDELKLRNRFIINKTSVDTRITANNFWSRAFNGKPYVPRDEKQHSINDPNDWYWKVNNSSLDVNDYDYRHISTTYNFDRIINPEGGKMVWVNDTAFTADAVFDAVRNAFNSITNATMTAAEHERIAAQLAVNIVDYIDTDNDITIFNPTGTLNSYHGYEHSGENLYISMVAVSQYCGDVTAPSPTIDTHYAIEFYNPGPASVDLANWQLDIRGRVSPTLPSDTVALKTSYILADDDTAAIAFGGADGKAVFKLMNNDHIELIRQGIVYDVVDDIGIFPAVHSLVANGLEKYASRRDQQSLDAGPNCEFPVWSSALSGWAPFNPLTKFSPTVVNPTTPIQLTVANQEMVTIGEISNVLAIGTINIGGTYFTMPQFWENIRANSTSGNIDNIAAGRIDLADADFANLLQYLTVFDPTNDNIDNDGDGQGVGNVDDDELKVAGRININTAPWFVMAQLPWMQYQTGGGVYDRAQAITESRDTAGAYTSIAELMRVGAMGNLAAGGNLVGGPDFTADNTADDLEERDIIFQRISNLVTVRSDVFTAYVLVRLGTDGPQKRVIAIFDRSDVYPDGSGGTLGKVKTIAVHPVPDPR